MIITNSVNIAAEPGGKDLEVLLMGGSLRKDSFSLVGLLAEDMLHLNQITVIGMSVERSSALSFRLRTSASPM